MVNFDRVLVTLRSTHKITFCFDNGTEILSFNSKEETDLAWKEIQEAFILGRVALDLSNIGPLSDAT